MKTKLKSDVPLRDIITEKPDTEYQETLVNYCIYIILVLLVNPKK